MFYAWSNSIQTLNGRIVFSEIERNFCGRGKGKLGVLVPHRSNISQPQSGLLSRMNERSFYEWTVVYGEKLLWSGLGEVGLARTSQPFSFSSSPISPNPFHLKGREQGQSYQCSGIMSHFYSFHVPLNFTSPGQLSWRPTFPFKSSGWLANSSPFHLHTNHHP